MKQGIQFTVEKERALVPVGEPCPFGCRYCYTRGGEVGPAQARADDILSLFNTFAHETSFETIQFGYDSDPFARPDRGIAMLRQLAMMGKHVNFSTKAALNGAVLDALGAIRCQMEAEGTTLSAQISLSCWESASVVEPHTPSPIERLQTLANLKHIGIPVFIALRPVLPLIEDREYEHIALAGLEAGCEGFILGPLYADARGQFVRFIPADILATVPRRTGNVPWSAHSPRWIRYEDPARLQRLVAMIEGRGGRTFLSSADAVALISHKEGVA